MGQDRLQSKGSEKLTEGRAFAGTMCWESREKAKDGGHPGPWAVMAPRTQKTLSASHRLLTGMRVGYKRFRGQFGNACHRL